MPRKSPTATQPKLDAESFLRSINIQYDLEFPERIAHFRPTAKCVTLLNALLGETSDRAFFVIAPYGTGKSITATYLLHLIENRAAAKDTLRAIESRLKSVSPGLYSFAAKRRKSSRKGLVIVLHGHIQDLPSALKEAGLAGMRRLKLGRQATALDRYPCETIEHAIGFLGDLKEKAGKAQVDRIAIVWEEFGGEVEWIIGEGGGWELMEI